MSTVTCRADGGHGPGLDVPPGDERDDAQPDRRPDCGQFGLDDEAFARSVANHMAYIDERKIDVQILGPRPFLMQGLMQDHLLPAWTRMVNDAIAKQCRMRPDRFLGAAQLPQNVHAPDAAHLLPELERCVGEHGFVGVYVSPDPEGRRNGPGLADRWWDPLYRRCEEGALPIVIHGTNCLDPRFRHVPHNYQLGFVVEQYLATQILSHGDVFDRFPGFKVVICHCGGALDRFIPATPTSPRRTCPRTCSSTRVPTTCTSWNAPSINGGWAGWCSAPKPPVRAGRPGRTARGSPVTIWCR